MRKSRPTAVSQGDLFGSSAPSSGRGTEAEGAAPSAEAIPAVVAAEPEATLPVNAVAEPPPSFKGQAPPAQVRAPGQSPGAQVGPGAAVGPAAPVGPAASAAVRASSQPTPPAKPQRVVLSVGDLTRQIKGTLERGYPNVIVRGEVSSFRGANVRGHLYFSLKDSEACIDAKVWASLASRLKFKLRDGMEVIAEGSIDLYEPQGRYSLIVHRLEPSGEGALALAFQQMKERLMAEGLFGDKRLRPPRPIPFLPRRIGVVTSLTGAALRDFLRVLHQRNPKLSVLIADARVQGEGSAAEVVRAIQRLSRTDVDVIVVTRGGGSIEDLWTFNEESVARAIFGCPKPVVSAIGHEVDYTISDFVADYRAPTPSAAAEKLAPVLKDLELQLATCESRLRKAAERHVLQDRQRLERLRARLSDPRRIVGQKRLHLTAQTDKLARGTRQAVRTRRDRLKALAERLARQHPQARLRQKRQELSRLNERLRAAMQQTLREDQTALRKLAAQLQRLTPVTRVHAEKRKLQQRTARLSELVRKRLFDGRHRLHGLASQLNAMSPLDVLTRGYSVTLRKDDRHVVRAATDVKPGDTVDILVSSTRCATVDECERIEATVTAVRGKG